MFYSLNFYSCVWSYVLKVVEENILKKNLFGFKKYVYKEELGNHEIAVILTYLFFLLPFSIALLLEEIGILSSKSINIYFLLLVLTGFIPVFYLYEILFIVLIESFEKIFYLDIKKRSKKNSLLNGDESFCFLIFLILFSFFSLIQMTYFQYEIFKDAFF